MLRTRIIPCLLLREESLVKTVQFKKPSYIGDPINTVRIFNELEVDELAFLDIMASRNKSKPSFDVLQTIADECFMPLSYGGGLRDVASADRIFQIGFEKVILNTALFERPELISEISKRFGSQSIIVAIDVKKSVWGKYCVTCRSGTEVRKRHPVAWAKEIESRGAGEILLTSIDREGTWKGFDVELIEQVSSAVSVPVIAHGGAGNVVDIGEVVKRGKASAVGLGSMVVYQRKGMGVLVNFPDSEQLARAMA